MRAKKPMDLRPLMAKAFPTPATLLTRSPMKRGKSKSKYATRERDVDFMLWVKTLPCLGARFSPCEGPVEADHAGSRGLGQKCPDDECIPLCTKHHRERTDFSGTFKTWNKPMMRSFLETGIANTKAQWARKQS